MPLKKPLFALLTLLPGYSKITQMSGNYARFNQNSQKPAKKTPAAFWVDRQAADITPKGERK